jgi:hypothetical protein
MSDSAGALILGSIIWFLGGLGLVAALVSGWTLFAPFAAVFIALGVGMCVAGLVWLVRA